MKQTLIALGIIALVSCKTTTRSPEPIISEKVTPKQEVAAEVHKDSHENFQEIGMASWYGSQFDGKRTASGEIFDRSKLTAAHPHIPFGTIIKVHNLENHKEANLTINDRGPYDETKIIEVTEKASEILSFKESGIAMVGINIIEEPNGATVVKDRGDVFTVDDDEDDDDEDDDLDEDTQPPKKEEPKKKPSTVTPPAAEKKTPPAKTIPVTPSPVKEVKDVKDVVKEVKDVKDAKTTNVTSPATSDSLPKGYTVQVGVFKDEKRAALFVKSLKATFTEKIFQFTRAGGTYVVQIGDYEKREDAVALKDRLKAKGITTGFIPPK